ncbi:hypothetical protein PG994_002447 [Apiospora phragmitis]|uniref:Uncharacterized protein n=1 Tax=Apiospora phragmitis TaxID=2905665 RepID=A0ABR1WWE4_9PEZI
MSKKNSGGDPVTALSLRHGSASKSVSSRRTQVEREMAASLTQLNGGSSTQTSTHGPNYAYFSNFRQAIFQFYEVLTSKSTSGVFDWPRLVFWQMGLGI